RGGRGGGSGARRGPGVAATSVSRPPPRLRGRVGRGKPLAPCLWLPPPRPPPHAAGLSGERFTMTRCMLGRIGANRSFPVVETQKGPSMQFVDSIFGRLLKPIDRREFRGAVQ